MFGRPGNNGWTTNNPAADRSVIMADVLTIVDTGSIYFNECVTGKRTPESITIGLYGNSVTITAATVMANLSPVTLHGLTTKVLACASWATPIINASGQSASAYASQAFTATAADIGTATNIYGYYAKSTTTGLLLWVVAFDTAKVITYENESITVVPEMRYAQKA
jgi:hypothetical protein